ncbi:formate dehydrogenase subunit delta [Lipingzhangella halophila]|uniref:Formate dehydrogenase subunit delta n=1 Tax=Lipingzhangella halophila TaxID=1783352 RepID=A0A7W7RK36_9ACTN|nr:formate dehydrogenase subunit delta [Lipingzhangella halophila]MBB4933429.1 formate dehydrogenase subunit delta [Lipingzhangella halophila]
MTATTSPQIRMVNDIAVQFHSRPPEKAVEWIADHIRKFWDPRMRADVRKRAAEQPEEFDPLALEAVRVLERETG